MREKIIPRPPARKPPPLGQGQLIGIVAPAGPVSPERLAAGIQLLKKQGLSFRVGDAVFCEAKGYLAGSDEERIQDLHSMFADPTIGAILCARGGYGSMRLLQQLDMELIGSHPKILLGYSDVTALLVGIYARCGLMTFHGPMIQDLDREEEGNLHLLAQFLTRPRAPRFSLGPADILVPGWATGPLLGGNLSLICHLVGTPFFPCMDGAILLLEETGEPLYRVDRMLTHLGLAGVLKRVSGVALGRFTHCGEPEELRRLLFEKFSPYRIPVVWNLPAGHGSANHPIALGAKAILDTEQAYLSVSPGLGAGHAAAF